MTRTSRNATLAMLSVAGFALGAPGALAQTTPNPIYGGGGTLSEPTLRLWADCGATPLVNDPGKYPASANFATNCTGTFTGVGGGAAFKYYLTATGSGAGLLALLTETPTVVGSTTGNGPAGQGTANGGKGNWTAAASAFNSATDGETLPPGYTSSATSGPNIPYYLFWDMTDSDAPINSPSPTGDGNTVGFDYNVGGLGPNGFNTKQNRGNAWALPVAATPVTIPYNPTNMNFVLLPGAPDKEDHKLQLSRDAICFIYTKADANGQVVPGNYDWSNPIFVSNTFGQTFQGNAIQSTTTTEDLPVPTGTSPPPASVTLTSITGIEVGETITGPAGIASGTTVASITPGVAPAGTITLSLQPTADVPNGSTLKFQVLNPSNQLPEPNPLPLNSVYSYNAHTGVYTVSATYSITGGTQPIVPFARSDDSGTTYLFTLWLSQNCAAFNDTTLGNAKGLGAQPGQTFPANSAFGSQVPQTTITWPSWVYQSYNTNGTIPTSQSGGGKATSGSGGVEAAVQATPGGVAYVSPTVDEPVVASTVPTAYVENGYGGASTTGKLKHQYVEPTFATVESAITKVAPPVWPSHSPAGAQNPKNPACGIKNPCGGTGQPPTTLGGVAAASWGSGLNKSFFHASNVGAYAITGLTYVMGYQCYEHDTGNDPYTGVLDFVSYYTNAGAGNNTDADNLMLSQGLVPIDFDSAVNANQSKDAAGNSRTFTQAVYDTVAPAQYPPPAPGVNATLPGDPATMMIPVTNTESFPNSPTTGHPLAGPYQCPEYSTDSGHE
ncbi:MAG TPA: hypothetical protein VKS60_22035 [Stellaceae bacterium]|nr:hypothetical protein [Stellaceae bacterium]